MRRCKIAMLPLPCVLLALLGLSDTAAGQSISLQDCSGNAAASPLPFFVPANTPHTSTAAQESFCAVSSNGATTSMQASTTVNGQATPWLYLNGANGTISNLSVPPAGWALTVAVDTSNSGLISGNTYFGAFQVCYSAGNNCDAINVRLAVTAGNSGGGTLSTNPTSLSFSAVAGGTTSTPLSASFAVLNSTTPTSGCTMSAATTTGGSWLLVNGGLGAAACIENSLTNEVPITINGAVLQGLAVGTYNGTITIIDSADNQAAVPVTLTVGGSIGLTATPEAFTFLYQIGQPTPASQNLQVSTNSATSIPFTVSTIASWLVPGALSCSVSSGVKCDILLSVNVTGLAKGSYTTDLVLNSLGGTPLATIPVALVISNNPLLQLSTSSLTFSASFSGQSPPSQTVQVTTTGTGGSVGFFAASDESWLHVSDSSSSTPANLTVSVNSGLLPMGTTLGTITVSPTNGDNYTETINVSVTVSNAAQITVGPSTLLFSYETSKSGPGLQAISVQSTGQSTLFSTSVSTSSCGNNWLSVPNASGSTTPATLQVAVSLPNTTAAGVCTGTVGITPAGSNTPVNISVSVAVSATTPLLTIEQTLGFGMFTMREGGPAPNPQNLILVSTDNTSLSFGVEFQSDRNWLYTAQTSGNTPDGLSVNVAPISLTAGTYGGTVTITSANLPPSLNGQFTIPITLVVTPNSGPGNGIPSKVGIIRLNTAQGSLITAEDVNGNIAWDPGTDHAYFFGLPGDIVIQGDWDASGTTKLGIFRPSAGMFALDMNGNGMWDPGVDTFGFFGTTGDVPIVGDWTGDGKSKIGIYRPSTNLFALDSNNDLTYEAGTDRIGHFGVSGDLPILGDWTGDGITKIGIYRPSASLFAEDVNNNLAWDAGVDKFGLFGVSGDTAIVGDWTGDGVSKIGIYRSSSSLWALDVNNNLAWDAGTDKSGVFGAPGDRWVVGDWDGTGIARAGIFRPSTGLWGLDLNGNLAWDASADLSGAFGAAGDSPVVGRWH